MTSFFQKMIFGSRPSNRPVRAIANKVRTIRAIWNNEHDDDLGIEKVLRLVLACSAFLFPGIYIKEATGRLGRDVQDLCVDLLVLIKVAFPIVLITTDLLNSPLLFWLMIWFMMETVLYIPTLIFASDNMGKPRSYRRSMLLLFFNYLEIIFEFSVIYAKGNFFNTPIQSWIDPVYFSFVTSSSIGFGEIYPITPLGKAVVCFHSVMFLVFVVVAINFFSSRVESTGYFDDSEQA